MTKPVTFILAAFLVVFTSSASAQEFVPMRAPEKMPEFQGGMPGLFAYLSGEIRYPETALEEAIEGRVVVSFVVEPDGAISDVRVVRGVHPDLDEEAVRAVNAMPKWIPGEQDGKPVRVRYTLPVSFKLGD